MLSIGSIHGGNRHNIIPAEVILQGTLRTFSENMREAARTMMKQTLEGCTAAYGASYAINYPGTELPGDDQRSRNSPPRACPKWSASSARRTSSPANR